MKYDLLSIPPFNSQFKRLTKKFPSLKREFKALSENLAESPFQGDPIGSSCYKLRLAIESKGKGKSGGARIITYVQVVQSTIFFLTIYDKSEKRDLTPNELRKLLRYIISE